MHRTGKKRPWNQCLGEISNLNELRHKRRRFDNIVLLRDGDQTNNNLADRRYYDDGELVNNSTRRILRAGGKRKQPDLTSEVIFNESEKASNENDIINELTQEFKKARLRPVFFTISSFIEQTVDEVGFTVADEPETEITVRLTIPNKDEFVNDQKTQAINCPKIETTVKNSGLNNKEFTPIETKSENVVKEDVSLNLKYESSQNTSLMERFPPTTETAAAACSDS